MFRTKVTEKMKKDILCSITSFSEFRAVYVILWKEYDKATQAAVDSTTWRMRVACCITKATNTHTGYVTLIAFPLQQCLHERTLMLRYM